MSPGVQPESLEGRSRKNVPFQDDRWYIENGVKLLDMHYRCDANRALEDVFFMLNSETPRITVNERKKRAVSDAHECEPREKRVQLNPCELEIMSEWYDTKNDELEAGPDGAQRGKER